MKGEVGVCETVWSPNGVGHARSFLSSLMSRFVSSPSCSTYRLPWLAPSESHHPRRLNQDCWGAGEDEAINLVRDKQSAFNIHYFEIKTKKQSSSRKKICPALTVVRILRPTWDDGGPDDGVLRARNSVSIGHRPTARQLRPSTSRNAFPAASSRHTQQVQNPRMPGPCSSANVGFSEWATPLLLSNDVSLAPFADCYIPPFASSDPRPSHASRVPRSGREAVTKTCSTATRQQQHYNTGAHVSAGAPSKDILLAFRLIGGGTLRRHFAAARRNNLAPIIVVSASGRSRPRCRRRETN